MKNNLLKEIAMLSGVTTSQAEKVLDAFFCMVEKDFINLQTITLKVVRNTDIYFGRKNEKENN